MNNTRTVNWTGSDHFALGAVGNATGDAARFGVDRVLLPNGSSLPVGVKARLGADPLVSDTDGDGLTDEFELLKMGLFTEVIRADTDGDGISDADEDFDGDNLTNIREQSSGTTPILTDTDGDDLSDGAEIAAGSDPLRPDTDYDGLDDDSEVRLGTNVTVPDSNGNGISDGNETYHSPAVNTSLGISVLVNGTRDLGKQVQITGFDVPVFQNNSVVSSLAFSLYLNGTMNSAEVTMSFDPATVSNPANLTLPSYNEETRTYDLQASTVNTGSHTVTGTIPSGSVVILLDMS